MFRPGAGHDLTVGGLEAGGLRAAVTVVTFCAARECGRCMITSVTLHPRIPWERLTGAKNRT